MRSLSDQPVPTCRCHAGRVRTPNSGRSGRSTIHRSPVAVAGVLLGLVLTACSGSTGETAEPISGSSPSRSAGSGGSAGADLESQYETVIRQVLPSVVEIRTETGLGSGVVYDNAGHIVTNAHVVGDATTFQVQLSSRPVPVKATLVGTFPAGDLAVIKAADTRELHPARFGDSDQADLGEIVLAMGNPLGLSSSVTNGIISATGRTLTEPQTPDSPGATLPDSIQTSAAINPGNSGGALVNLRSEVIGIPTLAATDQQSGGAAPGIGFAIPSNTVRRIADQLVKTGKVTNSGRAALGITASTVADLSGTAGGVAIASLVPGGAAAKAGLRAGDVIVKLAGRPVSDLQSMSAILADLDVGQTVPVSLQRNGSVQNLNVTLGELTSG